MKIIKQKDSENIFPYIAYVPDELSSSPALLIQLHGAGERGAGGEDLDKVLVHGFSKIVNDENFKDAILIMPQCPTESFWAAKVESIKKFIDKITLARYTNFRIIKTVVFVWTALRRRSIFLPKITIFQK